jgi:guanylate kinase
MLKSTTLMIILSSPSGAGKTTLSKAIINSDPQVKLSISVTTRPMRPGEINGKDYFFISKDEYDELLQKDMLLEHAEVFGNYYGIPKKQTNESLDAGFDMLYSIDWQGALKLMEYKPSKIVSIFILPPSIEILEQRLRKRGSESEEVIQRRLKEAKSEISKYIFYDYLIVNDKIEDSLFKIQSIISAERSKLIHLSNLSSLIDTLNEEIIGIYEKDIPLINNSCIIDVREPHEWQSGHVKNALHIPLQQLLSNNYQLDKNKFYIVYCQHGVRSLTAAKFLKTHGFHVAHLKGGLAVWQGELEK